MIIIHHSRNEIKFITTLVIFFVKMDKIQIFTSFYQFWLIFKHFWTNFEDTMPFFLYFFQLNVVFSPFYSKIIKFMHILLLEMGVLLNLAPILTILVIFCQIWLILAFSPKFRAWLFAEINSSYSN